MCMFKPKTPDLPEPAARQPAKLPDDGSIAARADLTAARRRALMATVLTTPSGVMGAPSTTASTSLG
jgi:hypothetical protein